MKIILLTKGQVAFVSDVDYDFLNQWLWFCTCSGYAARKVNGIGLRMHTVVAERMGIKGLPDHKDRNRLNNQRWNLRAATASQQNANQGIRVDNTSGYKGVTWDDRSHQWRADIYYKTRHTFLGYYSDLIRAAIAYDNAAVRLFGEFAVLNFPPEIMLA